MANTLEFCQVALKQRVAPPSRGSVKQRIDYASRKTGFGFNRTKDIWYADERVSISAEEIKRIEHLTGVEHGRTELRDIDQLLSQADALLSGSDPDFHSAFVVGMRAFISALAGSRVERRD